MTKKNEKAAVSNPFAALRHKNFLYYWIGIAVSTTGIWMQNAAQPWLAYKLTDSAFLLSIVSALQFTPVLLFSLFAGVLIDRFKKKNIIMITQAASLVITLVIAILVATGRIVYWHLLISSTLLGFVNTFDATARQAFIIEMVGKEDLSGGIALNSAQYNLARMLGPALAGIIMATWDISVCFFINAVSFGAVLVSLFFIKPMTVEKKTVKIDNIFRNIGDGLKFIFGKPILYMPMLFLAIAAIFAMNLGVLIPVFSDEVLHQQETGYGFLMSMGGVGALAGALTMASITKGGIKNAFVFVLPLIVGVLVAAIGFSSVYALTAIAVALMSFVYMIFLASVNTTIQLNSTNEYRGRVMSVYSIVMSGSAPLGNLFAGAVAEELGSGISFIVSGAVIVAVLLPLFFVVRKKGLNVRTQAPELM